jgi:hypothetical protein
VSELASPSADFVGVFGGGDPMADESAGAEVALRSRVRVSISRVSIVGVGMAERVWLELPLICTRLGVGPFVRAMVELISSCWANVMSGALWTCLGFCREFRGMA